MATNIKYLDPKADLTFKKIFGNHPDLLISLLNALLPLKKDQEIESIEYLPTEMIPVDPIHKDTIVDVRCKDILGRQFVVEMQMAWKNTFNPCFSVKIKEAPAELLENPEINKALEEVKISAFTEAELRAYDKFWDIVSSEKTLLEGSYDDGVRSVAKNLLSLHVPIETIISATGLSKEDIEKLVK